MESDVEKTLFSCPFGLGERSHPIYLEVCLKRHALTPPFSFFKSCIHFLNKGKRPTREIFDRNASCGLGLLERASCLICRCVSENAISYFSPSKICVGEQHFIKSPKAALEIAEDARELKP